MERDQIINLAAGPSTLPLPVLEEASRGLLNYQGTGIGLTELSHRSPEFSKLTTDLAHILRRTLSIPDSHEVLFTQGGGSLQFSAIVLNLLARHRLRFPDLRDEERVMDYVVTGSWSLKAAQEAQRLGGGKVNIVADGRTLSSDGKSFPAIPTPITEWKLSPNPAFIYYCDNETVDGIQFDGVTFDTDGPGLETKASFPATLIPRDPNDETLPVPLIGDFSSSFCSRPIHNLADHALIYAGVQKNLGPAGLTILIVRKDLLVDTVAASKLGSAPVPTTMDFSVMAKAGSLYNTPPMFPMYVSLLVLKHFEANGGIPALQKANSRKARKVYRAVIAGEKAGRFKLKVIDGFRSYMNVVFEVLGDGAEAKFIKGAVDAGFRGIKGHRSVGGIRVSLYNAVTEDQVDVLVKYIEEFLRT